MSGPLSADNIFFYLCGDWLREISDRGILPQMKNELDNFTSTLISDPYYYYASDFFFDSTTIIKEIKCLDLTYLMEQRLRYTHIRDELELPHLASKLRRKCGKCLKYSAGEHSDSGKEELEKPKEENQDPEKDMDNKDVTQAEAQQEVGITTETIESEKTDQGELSSASEASDSEETDQRRLDSISEIADSEKTDQGKPGSASETVDSEKVYQATSTGQEKKKKRKPRKKKGKSRNLEVLNRFWFKRDPSPPPEDEMEEHLDELRMRTRKEIHTLLFLSSAVQEGKIEMMKKYAAMLSKKSQKKWSKFIEKLDTEHEVHTQQPTEYNRNNLLERLEENPELLEAIDKIKTEEPLSKTIMANSFEIATRIERQIFSLIPGVPGLIAYRNAMICEVGRDESTTITV